MAESRVIVPHIFDGEDFLAFSFMGKHSYEDFGIIRTSDGNRYNEDLSPQFSDITAEVPGGEGLYYFGTKNKQRDFNVSFAFDGLTEGKLRELKTWLNGKEMGDLWFSEAPFKVYTVKVTGKPSLKTLCFDKFDETTNTFQRIYKGEGSVVFTAYWPYAHTPDTVIYQGKIHQGTRGVITPQEYEFLRHSSKIYLKSCSGGYSIAQKITNWSISDGTKTIRPDPNGVLDGTQLFNLNSETLRYQTTGSTYLFIESEGDGKYMTSYYCFVNASQWDEEYLYYDGSKQFENPGDLPAPFVVEITSVQKGDTIKFAGSTIVLQEDAENVMWDSKSGIISGIADGEESPRAIRYDGNGFGEIPIGGIEFMESEFPNSYTVKYNYWYY